MRARIFLLVVLAAAVTAVPATGAGASWKGVVVGKDLERKTIVTASANGAVRTLRAPKQVRSVRVGQRVAVSAAVLRDGTYGIKKLRVTGRAKQARAGGVVIRNDRKRARYVLSAGGSTLVIRKASPARRLASVVSAPKVGDRVVVTVEIGANGTVEADEIEVLGKVGELDIEGEFVGRDGNAIKVEVAAGQVLRAVVPAGFELPKLRPGDQVELEVAVGANGTFTLLEIEIEDEECSDGSTDSSSDSSDGRSDTSSDSSHDWSSCGDEGDESSDSSSDSSGKKGDKSSDSSNDRSSG